MVAACGSNNASSPSTVTVTKPASTVPSAASASAGSGPPAESGECDLQPTEHDLILWERAPRLLDNSIEIGDVDLGHCQPTLATWASMQPTGPGFCTKIAWADDNPGYPIGSRPSRPLKKVIDEVGAAC
jgi:hypothetical protein